VDYIRWGIAWINIRMMLADAPRYMPSTGSGTGKVKPEEDFLDDFCEA